MMVYEAARDEARKLAQHFHNDHGIASLVHLANRLGATVDFVNDLPDNASGMVVQQKGSDPQIFIKADEITTRQRFTLAHEIGHIIERQTFGNDDEYSFVDFRSSNNKNMHEFFANEFAGELLMPKEEFLEQLRRKGPVMTSLHFGVSLPAVRERKRRLERHP